MSQAALSTIVARAARAVDPSPATDGGLLARFARTRDDRAFAELVHRLGPMVLGVCRRVTRDTHLADDAFQAVLVVLARRATDVRPPEAVRGWLYRVAVRTAQEARAVSARRLAREVPVAQVPDRASEPDEVPDADALRVLDEEVAALPDHLRAAVALCELDGLSRRDAAARLDIPEGTLSSRLAKARKVLADRLRARGLALPATGLAVLAQATLPPQLLARTAALATSGAPVPSAVAVLTKRVFRTMLFQRLAVTGLSAVFVAACAFATSATTPPAPAAFAPRGADPVQPKAAPAPQAAGTLLFYRAGHLTLIDPDGKNERRLAPDQKQFLSGQAKFSPDGKKLAVLVHTNLAAPKNPFFNLTLDRRLYVRGVNEKEPGTDLGVKCDQFAWSPDGTEIACHDIRAEGSPAVRNFVVDVATKKVTAVQLPELTQIGDWSRDGKHFLTNHMSGVIVIEAGQSTQPPSHLSLTNRDGTEHKALTDPEEFALFGRFSPDNKRVLYSAYPSEKGKVHGPLALRVLDVASGKSTPVEGAPNASWMSSYCWSPDGKRIAYTWKKVPPGAIANSREQETESYLVVCDSNGKNAKTLATEKGKGRYLITLGSVEWRP